MIDRGALRGVFGTGAELYHDQRSFTQLAADGGRLSHSGSMKDELITAGLALIGAALVAVLTWWLTEHSRNVAEAAKERAVAEALLGAQSDALLLAVIDLQIAARTNHVLWESKAETASTVLLALGAAAGGYARSDADVPQWRRMWVAWGEMSQVVFRDRIAKKNAISTVKVELGRLAAAAVPLMRHPDARVRTATEHVMEAATANTMDQAAVGTAMREFGEAIRAVLPSWSTPPEAEARS